MITKEKMPLSVIKFSQLILGEFVCGYWGLKGLISDPAKTY